MHLLLIKYLLLLLTTLTLPLVHAETKTTLSPPVFDFSTAPDAECAKKECVGAISDSVNKIVKSITTDRLWEYTDDQQGSFTFRFCGNKYYFAFYTFVSPISFFLPLPPSLLSSLDFSPPPRNDI